LSEYVQSPFNPNEVIHFNPATDFFALRSPVREKYKNGQR
jgi:hypothetical protein